MKATLNVNDHAREVDADPDTPLLWVLRDNSGSQVERSIVMTLGAGEPGLPGFTPALTNAIFDLKKV